MIPGRFTYHRPSSLAEAVAVLARHGDEARPLAGGHSLIPMMKLRMAVPEHLIDLAGLADLRGIAEDDNGVVIGASTTQHDLIASDLLADRLPILRETALQIADPQIRSKGTLGGNVANGDPGNDMPAVMQCLDASYTLAGPDGERRVAARDYYQGAYVTAQAPGEILVRVHIPVPPVGHGFAYEKLKRKIGDYATAATAVILTFDSAGAGAGDRVASVAVALTNLAETPLLVEEAANLLVGGTLDPAAIERVVAAARTIADPATDGRGTADYRRAMAGIVTARALAKAAARARSGV